MVTLLSIPGIFCYSDQVDSKGFSCIMPSQSHLLLVAKSITPYICTPANFSCKSTVCRLQYKRQSCCTLLTQCTLKDLAKYPTWFAKKSSRCDFCHVSIWQFHGQKTKAVKAVTYVRKTRINLIATL